MKFILLACFCFYFSCTGYSQKIVYEKTDPFSGKRTVVADNLPLVKTGPISVLQVGAAFDNKHDTLLQFRISFIIINPGAVIQTTDTTTAFKCLIKTSDDSVIIGKYLGMASATIGGQAYSGFTYVLEMNDMFSLVGANCTDVKFTGPNGNEYLFTIDKNKQDNINKEVSALINKMEFKSK